MKYVLYICIVFITHFNLLYSQSSTLTIEIIPDDFPQDISWELLDQYTIAIESGNTAGCTPFQSCITTITLENQECYTFIIRDAFGDGIESPGGYRLQLNGVEIVANGFSTFNMQHDINCGLGESCVNPVILSLPTSPFDKIKAPKDKDYWFKLVPEDDGLYRVTTCVNLISGQGYPDTKLWIYDTCDRNIIEEGPEGAIGFSDDFIQCEPASAFHYFPLNADQTYYIRHRRLMDEVDIDSVEVKILKLPTISGCTDSLACNFNPYANTDNGSCEYTAGCGPDLSLDQEELMNSVYVDTIHTNDDCLVTEGCLRGPGSREVIRFSTKIDNIGSTDYILGSPEKSPQNFTKNNCHGHWHHEGYAEYLLYAGGGRPEPVGFKTGFCVLDLDCDGVIPKYICSYMGISAGCSDIYNSDIDCQWVDITDTPDGTYTLVVRVNWNRYPDYRGFHELDYENNWGQVCFSLDRSSGKTIISIQENCDQYKDCLGLTNGQTQIDCEGICGGSSHYGDINQSGELEKTDILTYMEMLENGLDNSSSCYDLDGDGMLNIYDVALANECVQNVNSSLTSPFHNHCQFPTGFYNEQESVFLRIGNYSIEDNYLELEIWPLIDDLSAYQIEMDGIVISSVEKLYEDQHSFLVNSDSKVAGLHGDILLKRTSGYIPFLKINFSEMILDDICINEESIVVNSKFDQININLTNKCVLSTSIQEVYKEGPRVEIHPNPTNDLLTIKADNQAITSIEILNATGQLLMKYAVVDKNEKSITLKEYNPGVYLIKTTCNKKSYVTKVIKI